MNYTRIVGLDLSLTSTGVAVVEHTAYTDRAPSLTIDTDSITSKGGRGDSLTDRHARLSQLVHKITLHASGSDLVVIEAPAFSRSNPGMHDRSGLWWLIVDALAYTDTPIATVPPSTRAKYATGKGNAGKDQVLAAVVRRYVAAEPSGNDEADALVLAAMGCRHLGIPLETTLPAANLASMDAVAWPAAEEVA